MENVRIKKKNIPPEFLQYFKLNKKGERWRLRNEIIWEKPNAIPSSSKDRFTVNWESIFFFTKSPKYYFGQQFEPFQESSYKRALGTYSSSKKDAITSPRDNRPLFDNARNKKWSNKLLAKELIGRNKRSVWRISTKSFPDAHFATFPPEIVETPIKAGSPLGGIVLDPFMGSGTTALVALGLSRKFIGIDLSPTYVAMAKKRIEKEVPLLL